MMMSSESFYEENLKGWSTEEISAQIDGLRREIAELKAALRSPDNYSEPQIMPSNDVRLAMALDYFDVAKTAFIAAGGKFSPKPLQQLFPETASPLRASLFCNPTTSKNKAMSTKKASLSPHFARSTSAIGIANIPARRCSTASNGGSR